MMKFIRAQNFSESGLPKKEEMILAIDVRDSSKSNEKKIEIGTRAKLVLSAIQDPDTETKFRSECTQFYREATHYLMRHLPHNVNLLRYAQFLHPLRRKELASTNAISNAAHTIAQVINCVACDSLYYQFIL